MIREKYRRWKKRLGITVCLATLFFGGDVVRADSALEGDKKEITIWRMGSNVSDSSEENQLFWKYGKEVCPEAEINIQIMPDEEYYAALKLGLASGEVADIISVQSRNAGENAVVRLAETGNLEDLSDMNLEGLDKKYLMENMGVDGKIYALAQSNGWAFGLCTLYNKAYFEQCGLEVPTCWEEFLECCRILKQNKIIPITMGDRDAFAMQFGLYQLAANVIYPVNPQYDEELWTGESKFTDVGTWDKVLEMYAELYRKGYIDESSFSMRNIAAWDKFDRGGAAMIFGTLPYSVEEGIGYFPLPGNKKGESIKVSASLGGGGYGIYSGSEYKEECKEILRRVQLAKSEKNAAVIPEIYQTAIENGTNVEICNRSWPSGAENELERLFTEYLLSDDMLISEVTSGMQKRIDELLERY